MILTLTGASGAGKTTLAKALLRMLPSAELSPGCTTRAMRPNETAEHVHHLNRKKFDQMRQRGEFLWVVEVHGHLYGTLRSIVTDGIAAPDHYLLLVLTCDVLPILTDFATECGNREAVRSVYVLSPEPSTLRVRLNAREMDNESIERRLTDCFSWDRDARSSKLYDLLVPGEGEIKMNARQVIDGLALL